MMLIRQKWMLVVVIVACTAVPVDAQTPVRWKFVKGDEFYQETVAVMKQTVTHSGQTINQAWEQVTISKFRVIQSPPTSNNTQLEQIIESVRITGTSQTAATAKALEAMQGSTFMITLDTQNKIQTFEGYEEFLKKVGGDDPQVGQLVRTAASQDTLKKAIEESFAFLEEQTAIGKPWKREFSIGLGPLGAVNATHNYVYEGNEARGGKMLAKIGVTATLTYQAPKGEAASRLNFQITKGELKADNAKGAIWFDAALGRLVESEMKMHLKGSLTVSANGQDFPLDIDQDQSIHVRMSSSPPAPQK